MTCYIFHTWNTSAKKIKKKLLGSESLTVYFISLQESRKGKILHKTNSHLSSTFIIVLVQYYDYYP